MNNLEPFEVIASDSDNLSHIYLNHENPPKAENYTEENGNIATPSKEKENHVLNNAKKYKSKNLQELYPNDMTNSMILFYTSLSTLNNWKRSLPFSWKFLMQFKLLELTDDHFTDYNQSLSVSSDKLDLNTIKKRDFTDRTNKLEFRIIPIVTDSEISNISTSEMLHGACLFHNLIITLSGSKYTTSTTTSPTPIYSSLLFNNLTKIELKNKAVGCLKSNHNGGISSDAIFVSSKKILVPDVSLIHNAENTENHYCDKDINKTTLDNYATIEKRLKEFSKICNINRPDPIQSTPDSENLSPSSSPLSSINPNIELHESNSKPHSEYHDKKSKKISNTENDVKNKISFANRIHNSLNCFYQWLGITMMSNNGMFCLKKNAYTRNIVKKEHI